MEDYLPTRSSCELIASSTFPVGQPDHSKDVLPVERFTVIVTPAILMLLRHFHLGKHVADCNAMVQYQLAYRDANSMSVQILHSDTRRVPDQGNGYEIAAKITSHTTRPSNIDFTGCAVYLSKLDQSGTLPIKCTRQDKECYVITYRPTHEC